MADVLVQFSDPVTIRGGRAYIARACGSEMPDALWQGWIEFVPIGGGEPLRTGRETTQPNRADVLYWATGLTPVYLEGALERALKPAHRPIEPDIPPPIFDGPAPDLPPSPPLPESIQNPLSVYRKGERLLRSQLGALSQRHLVNVIRAHELSDLDADALNGLSEAALIELIVAAVQSAEEPTASR